MKPKNIDLANKCGSCCHFEPIEGTCSGYCLQNKYGANVVFDPNHPYWQVQRSRMKCVDYNKKPMTNADHIRSLSDEELAEFLCSVYDEDEDRAKFINGIIIPAYSEQDIEDWLKQPYLEEDT